MAHSLEFNTTDLSTYKLVVTSPGNNLLRQLIGQVQLQESGHAFRPMKKPRPIKVKFSVTGTSRENLDSNLDNIKKLVTLLVPKALIFDTLPGRHFNAILEDFRGDYGGANLFEGRMDFTCPDPLGYGIVEYKDHDHEIGATETTVDEVVGGTAYTDPILTLLAKNDLTETIKVENLTTEEELKWKGSLEINDTLEIDVARMQVRKGVDLSMASVTGKFPRLKPGVTNEIKVTDLYTGTKGYLNIKYRDAFL